MDSYINTLGVRAILCLYKVLLFGLTLVELANYYEPRIQQPIDPMTEILVTVGATQAIYTSIQSLVGPGDKVMIMQPFYDSYPASVHLAMATPVFVSLTSKPGITRASEWTLDVDYMRRILSKEKVKVFILNNPHNPLGKVFSREELLEIAQLAEEFNLTVIADEVYETLTFSTPMIKFGNLNHPFIFSFFAWNVQENDYYWKCRQNVWDYRLEIGLVFRSIVIDSSHLDDSSVHSLFCSYTFARGSRFGFERSSDQWLF
jgi:hypothetical protein